MTAHVTDNATPTYEHVRGKVFLVGDSSELQVLGREIAALVA